MPSVDPYNQEVRARFAKPVNAGDLDGDYPVVIEGVAAASANGTTVQVTAGIEGGMIRALRFRAWGCPHVVAATDLACSLAEGQPVAGLADITASGLMARLDVPRTKAGRIFLIEDALRSIAGQHEDKR